MLGFISCRWSVLSFQRTFSTGSTSSLPAARPYELRAAYMRRINKRLFQLTEFKCSGLKGNFSTHSCLQILKRASPQCHYEPGLTLKENVHQTSGNVNKLIQRLYRLSLSTVHWLEIASALPCKIEFPNYTGSKMSIKKILEYMFLLMYMGFLCLDSFCLHHVNYLTSLSIYWLNTISNDIHAEKKSALHYSVCEVFENDKCSYLYKR